jgi:radical SAM protein with 4Fe4S-binding SPASM domain
MLQKRNELILNTFKRNGFAGIANLALRYYEQNKMPGSLHYTPTALQVEVTTSCNLKCTMCEHTFMQEIGRNLKFSEFKKILDENKNVQVVNLTGIGEALLNPEFIKMIEYAKSNGIYVWFNDNFTLMNQEKAEKLLELGADFIILSLDGATKKTYEKIRVGADFDKVTKNFVMLRKLRDKKKLEKPKLGINSVVLKENFHEIEEMVKLVNELKADNLMFVSIVMSDNTGKLSLWNLDSNETRPFVEKAKQTAEKLNVKVIGWPSVELKKTEKTGCVYPWVNPYIGFNGDVLPCCYIPQMANARLKEENIMGNIIGEPLTKIWNGKKYSEFRKKIKTKNPPEACRTCSKFYGQ